MAGLLALYVALSVQQAGTNKNLELFVDTHDNLDAVWARVANKAVVLCAGPSDSSFALTTLNNGDIIKLVGEREVNGVKWYVGNWLDMTRKIFDPIHFGSSIDEVDTPEGLVIQLSTKYYACNGQVGSPYSFCFFIKDDEVILMEYCWAYSGQRCVKQ